MREEEKTRIEIGYEVAKDYLDRLPVKLAFELLKEFPTQHRLDFLVGILVISRTKYDSK